MKTLSKAKAEIAVQAGAGAAAGYGDAAYEAAGAVIVKDRAELLKSADCVAQVRALGATGADPLADISLMKSGASLVATVDPLLAPEPIREAAKRGINVFSLELVPRTTRAQTMDVLSSQNNLSGYKAVLLAANALPKILPMMTTAAGTLPASRVLVLGAAVAGLQAIATARRLGAVVSGYDIRPVCKTDVESLGARWVDLGLDTADAQAAGGYAKAMDDERQKKQRELLTPFLAQVDIVITTALIPGRKAPLMITKDMVEAMAPGSVIVDIAAERGGNCELSEAGKTIEHKGVTIIGPVNLPSTVATHASLMFAKNVATFLLNLIDKEGAWKIDREDDIVKGSLLTWEGEVVDQRIIDLLKK
jgi:NAD(P) transhydrogenase subunit alpha